MSMDQVLEGPELAGLGEGAALAVRLPPAAGDEDGVGLGEEEAQRLAHQLRGSLNALGMSLRVLESGPPDAESREFAGYVTQAAARIRRLVAKLQSQADA